MGNRQLLDIPHTYKIRVQGRIDPQWSDWFDAFTITPIGDESLLTGLVADQAALHGLISKIRDLGLPLLCVQQMGDE
ncbi:MAG: hypothetical protein GY805_03575 [Chloroflexi bacterium]|nr:hypothetical protein [Chloroflexota bacterium]